MHRRFFLKSTALLTAALALPHQAWAAWPNKAFKSGKIKDAMMSLYGAADYTTSDAILFKAPEIAENGAVVPLSISFDGQVKNIAVLVEENPAPLAAFFEFGPKSAASVSTRIKMGDSSLVHAVAQTADGQLIGVAKEVKVTIGGCGG